MKSEESFKRGRLTKRQLKELRMDLSGIRYKRKAHFTKEQAEEFKKRLENEKRN